MTGAVLHTLFLFLEKQKLAMIQARCNGSAAKQTSDLSSFQKLIFVQPFLVKLCDHFPHVKIGIIFHPIIEIKFMVIFWQLEIFFSVDILLEDEAIKKS